MTRLPLHLSSRPQIISVTFPTLIGNPSRPGDGSRRGCPRLRPCVRRDRQVLPAQRRPPALHGTGPRGEFFFCLSYRKAYFRRQSFAPILLRTVLAKRFFLLKKKLDPKDLEIAIELLQQIEHSRLSGHAHFQSTGKVFIFCSRIGVMPVAD